jgi:hypothetical protein
MPTVPAGPPQRGRSRQGSVWTGKRKILSRIPDPVRRANFVKRENETIAELQRVGIEKATLATSPHAKCSACGAPVHRGELEQRAEAKPLCPRAHAVISESHAERVAAAAAKRASDAAAKAAPAKPGPDAPPVVAPPSTVGAPSGAVPATTTTTSPSAAPSPPAGPSVAKAT